MRVALFLCTFFCAILSHSLAQYPIIDIAKLKQQIKETKETKEDTTLTRLYGILGWELRFSNQAEAVQLANEIIRISEKRNEYIRLAEAYRIKGFVKAVKQELPACLELYAKGIDYAQKAKSGYYQASFLSLTAGLYQDKGDFDRAIQYYLEGLKIAEDSKEPVMIAALANNLGEAYSDAGRPISFTLPFYQKSLKQVIAAENWQYAAMVYSNIAKEYKLIDNKTEAEKAVKQSIEYLNKKNDGGYVYATTITGIGEILTGLGKYPEAEKYLLKAVTILDSLHTTDNLIISISALAQLYYVSNQPNKAEIYSKQLLAKATECKGKLFLRNANKILSDLAKKRNQPELALQYFEQYKNWNDSLFNESKEKSIANAESRVKISEKALENELLKKSNNNLQNSMFITMGLATVLLIVGILLIVGYRITKTKNKQLQKQKAFIENESIEKDTLIREIHHRVKNNLQVVSSLLNLQANSLTHEKAIEALKESQQKVKAIALIHQNLYAFDKLSAIPINDYITELFSDMRVLFGTSHIKLECTTLPEGLLLDLESAVPLGLILSETITNAMKYAFVGGEPGIITIVCTENANQTYSVSITDNGKGLPEGLDPMKSETLGFRIIKELSRQLRGEFSFSTGKGAHFTIIFPNTDARKMMA